MENRTLLVLSGTQLSEWMILHYPLVQLADRANRLRDKKVAVRAKIKAFMAGTWTIVIFTGIGLLISAWFKWKIATLIFDVLYLAAIISFFALWTYKLVASHYYDKQISMIDRMVLKW